jgi:hypothetical protein
MPRGGSTRPSIHRPGAHPSCQQASQKENAIFSPPPPPPLPELAKLAQHGTLPGILRRLSGLRCCTHPIRLDGHRTEYDVDTRTGEIGNVLHRLDSSSLPAGHLLAAATTAAPPAARPAPRSTAATPST